jgi:hypothetical protein
MEESDNNLAHQLAVIPSPPSPYVDTLPNLKKRLQDYYDNSEKSTTSAPQFKGVKQGKQWTATNMQGDPITQGVFFQDHPWIGAAGAAEGFVPSFAKLAGSVQKRLPLTVSSKGAKPNTGFKDESKFSNAGVVKFTSSVGKESFSNVRAKSVNDPKDEGKALQVLFVSPAPKHLRGKGYGKDLYNHMFNYAKSSGHNALLGDSGTSFSAMHVVESVGK